jgi:hypothetical protein
MLTSKEFVAKLGKENEALFAASEMQVAAFFNANPTKEALVEHFTGRMVNERMNMVEISNKVANASLDMPAKELALLSKQAHDEAVHFRMVKEVIEHLTGAPVVIADAIASDTEVATAKGAALLAKYEAQSDEAALAAYQFIAEGRAERVWNKMAEVIDDQFISSRYAKIAKDEGFHSKIGRAKLIDLCDDAGVQARVEEIATKMRWDLYNVSCLNTVELVEARALVTEAYGA